jgi:hypothetical protein
MLLRPIFLATLLFVHTPVSSASEQGSGYMRRVSCTVVRYYVAKYSEAVAETWARSHGATDADIEAARNCLKYVPAQTVQSASLRGQ